MKNILRTFFLTSVATLVAALPSFAQQRTMSGIVTDSSGEPIPGVSVSYHDGKKLNGTATGIDGDFSLPIPGTVTEVTFSCIGFSDLVYGLTGDGLTGLTIVLQDDETLTLDQVVVTGYAQTTVKRITGSVGIMDKEKFEAKPLASVSSLMQGEIAGVQIQALSGQPGTESRIRIRGANNISG
ncbi:MAG: carboxypeptidase regulatory-like domain-containing protein, partial [Bacteroidales bacterium]|nr:carboxypeptidase regulatory-like domain-containing protein [Bacteroidales bacterium]